MKGIDWVISGQQTRLHPIPILVVRFAQHIVRAFIPLPQFGADQHAAAEFQFLR